MPFPAEFDAIRVVLVSTRNPLNIGAAARALCNFGFRSLRIVHPFEASFREARSAVGAAPVLANAEEYPSVGDAIADCTLVVGTTPDARRQPQHPQKFLKEGAEAIHQHLQTDSSNRRVAILFGSEKTGAYPRASQPLRLAATYPYRGGAAFHESRAGRCGVSV